jgi:hypothetical protein
MQGDARQGVAALLRCQLSHATNLSLLLPQQADAAAATPDDDGPPPLLPAAPVARALAPRGRFNVVVVTPVDMAQSNVGLAAAMKIDPHLTRCGPCLYSILASLARAVGLQPTSGCCFVTGWRSLSEQSSAADVPSC